MIEKLARLLTRRPRLVALIALAAIVPSLLGYAATRVNYDILSYLPKDLASTQGEQLLEEPFHMAATSMLVVENMPAGYTDDLLCEIRELPGVSNALWISDLVGIQLPQAMIPARYREVFYSGDCTMMIVQYEKPAAAEETMDAIAAIRGICNEKCFLAGFSVVIKDMRILVDREMPIFILLAVVLALGAMALTLESTVLPFVLMVNIGLAIVYNIGTNFIFGEISYITKALAAILQLGVTMDYSVFLYRRFEEERSRYADVRDAMAQAVTAAFRSLGGSSLTTIAGFLAMCAMRLTLGKDIGIVMAKGVLFGVLTVIVILPSLLLIADRQIRQHLHKPLLPRFDRLNGFLVRHRVILSAAAVLMILPAYYAQGHINIYYKLDEALPRDLPSITANEKLKSSFDMATSHYVVLRDDLPSVQMERMESEIRDTDGVTGVICYHSILGTGIPDFFVPRAVREMLKQGGYQLMMINTSCETASDAAAEQLTALNEIITGYDEGALITGEAALTKDLIEVMGTDFQTASLISLCAIFVIVMVVFRSISVPVVLVAMIELAIFVNQGISYFTGAEVPFIAPTFISCVQLGATVDYAILMTTRFREEIQSGKDRFAAAAIAGSVSDPAIITSALVLLGATLGVALVSSIDFISAVCVMLARGSVLSALMIIFLLPPVLCLCEPVFRHTSLHWRKEPAKKAEEAVVSK